MSNANATRQPQPGFASLEEEDEFFNMPINPNPPNAAAEAHVLGLTVAQYHAYRAQFKTETEFFNSLPDEIQTGLAVLEMQQMNIVLAESGRPDLMLHNLVINHPEVFDEETIAAAKLQAAQFNN